MQRTMLTRVLWTVLASLAIVFGEVSPGVAQEKQAPAKKEAATKKRKKPRGRLPNYYGEVVSKEQRKEIYEIQAEYREQIHALRTQLAALMKEQKEKIRAVLTPEQLKKIEELEAAAKAKREKEKAKKATEKKPATKKPAEKKPAAAE